MPVIVTEPATSALLATLQTGTGFPVGDHGPPTPTVAVPRPTAGRYCILQAIPGGALFGSQAFEAEMATLVYQVDSMARSRAQCQWLADRVRQVMLDRGPSSYVHQIIVSGWVLAHRSQQTVDSPVDEGRDETGESLWSCRERYEVTVVPS
jgi:hypothetical protein